MAGRDFTDADGPGAPQVAVVNETFVALLLRRQGSRSAAGSGRAATTSRRSTIVGVVKDGKAATLREKPIRFVYVPYRQQETSAP